MNIKIKSQEETISYLRQAENLRYALYHYVITLTDSLNSIPENDERYTKERSFRDLMNEQHSELESLIYMSNELNNKASPNFNDERNPEIEEDFAAMICLLGFKIQDIFSIINENLNELPSNGLRVSHSFSLLRDFLQTIESFSQPYETINEAKGYPEPANTVGRVNLIIKNGFIIQDTEVNLVKILPKEIFKSRSRTPLIVGIAYLSRYKNLSTEDKLKSFDPELEELLKLRELVESVTNKKAINNAINKMAYYFEALQNNTQTEKTELGNLIRNLELLHKESLRNLYNLPTDETGVVKEIEKFKKAVFRDIENKTVKNIKIRRNSNKELTVDISLEAAPIKFIDLSRILKVGTELTGAHINFLKKVEKEEYFLYNGPIKLILQTSISQSYVSDSFIKDLLKRELNTAEIQEVVRTSKTFKDIDFSFEFANHAHPSHLEYNRAKGCRGGYATQVNRHSQEKNILGVYVVAKDFSQTVNLFDIAGIESLKKLIICDKDGIVKYIPSGSSPNGTGGTLNKDIHISQLYDQFMRIINLGSVFVKERRTEEVEVEAEGEE